MITLSPAGALWTGQGVQIVITIWGADPTDPPDTGDCADPGALLPQLARVRGWLDAFAGEVRDMEARFSDAVAEGGGGDAPVCCSAHAPTPEVCDPASPPDWTPDTCWSDCATEPLAPGILRLMQRFPRMYPERVRVLGWSAYTDHSPYHTTVRAWRRAIRAPRASVCVALDPVDWRVCWAPDGVCMTANNPCPEETR